MKLGWTPSRCRKDGISWPVPRRKAISPCGGSISTVSCAFSMPILRTAASATAKLLTTVAIGVWASRRGVLDRTVVSALSRTVYHVFLPAMLFVNIVATLVEAENRIQLVALPLIAMAQILFGFLSGQFIRWIFRIRGGTSEASSVTISTTFGNSAALPLLFATALFGSNPAMLGSMVSSISFFLLGWTPLFWSWGYSMMAGKRDRESAQGRGKLSGQSGSGWTRIRENDVVKRVVSPPILGSLAGLVVGLTPSLRSIIALPESPLSFVFSSLQTLGTGYAPCSVLVLAGSLLAGARQESDLSSQSHSRRLNPREIISISFVRFTVVPLMTFALLRLLRAISISLSPMIQFSVLLQATMPSAQNTVIMLQLEGKQREAESMAKMLLFVYLISIVPVSATISLALNYSGLLLP